MTLQQVLRGKCPTCLWNLNGRCLIRENRSGNAYCKRHFVDSKGFDGLEFLITIKRVRDLDYVYINSRRLPNPAARPSAPLHFLAYKLIELARSYFGLDELTMKITDLKANKMLHAILDACKQQSKVKIIAGSMILAFARYASRTKIGTLYGQDNNTHQ